MTKDEVLGKVREVLVAALGVDDDEVTLQATLKDDLGAESIDFLDILFRLEKTFGIKIEQAEFTQSEVLGHPNFVKDGKVSDAGMEQLRSRLPFIDFDQFDQTREVAQFMDLFTVEVLVRFVESKIQSTASS